MVQHDKEILNSIYGWYGQANGKAERPKCFLPECIKERIRYFQPQMEEGLTFAIYTGNQRIRKRLIR